MPRVLDEIKPLGDNDTYLLFDTKYGNTAEAVGSEAKRLAISVQRTDNKIVIQKDKKPYGVYLGHVINDIPSWELLGYLYDSTPHPSLNLYDGGNADSQYGADEFLDGGSASSSFSAHVDGGYN